MPNETKAVTHGTASLLSLLTLVAANPVVAATQAPTETPIPERLAAVRERLEAGKQELTTLEQSSFRDRLLLAAWEDVWVNFNDGAYWEDIWSDFSNY